MSRKHPMVVGMEKRIEERKIEIDQIGTQIFVLSDRRKALQELQEQDQEFLAVNTTRPPRKKTEAKDGKQRMEEV